MRRAIAGVGRALVTTGLLILLFVAYQLWGTGYFTGRAQAALRDDFKKAQQQYQAEQDTVATAPSTVDPAASTTTTTSGPLTKPAPPIPPKGNVEGVIEIPKIGLKIDFVEGTDRDQLAKGPGHYPDTPMPGTIGNAAIAGHRTTYAHPFNRVDELRTGDDVIITTVAGKFTYEIDRDPFTVKPTDFSVVQNTPDPQLTLTSCHPKYSAAQRIVIKAKLVANKSDAPTKSAPIVHTDDPGKSVQDGLAEGLSGQDKSLHPTVLWGLIAALVGVLWWWGFRRWRHPVTWLIGVVPFLAALIPFYVFLERALPAGL